MSPTPLIRRFALALLALSIALPAQAAEALRLPSFFSDGMVLQRDQPVKIWGWGKEGSEVTVDFADQKTTAKVEDGRWKATLPAMPADAVGRTLVLSSGSEKREVRDVIIGDVWICGGQSNMEWRLRGTRDADLEIPAADHPGLRYFRIEPEGVPEPRTDIPVSDTAGTWQACTPETAGDCSGGRLLLRAPAASEPRRAGRPDQCRLGRHHGPALGHTGDARDPADDEAVHRRV